MIAAELRSQQVMNHKYLGTHIQCNTMATKVYEGKYSNSSAQILLVERGKIYSGKYANSSEEIKHVDMHGLLFKADKVYRGKYPNSSDQVITIQGGKVYQGKYTNSSDQIALIEGDRLTDEEFEKVIYLIAQRNGLL